MGGILPGKEQILSGSVSSPGLPFQGSPNSGLFVTQPHNGLGVTLGGNQYFDLNPINFALGFKPPNIYSPALLASSPYTFGGFDPAVDICLSPNGKFLYALTPTKIIAWARDLTNGNLSAIAGSPFSFPGATPGNSLSVSPDSAYLYVSSGDEFTNDLNVFSINASTGVITFSSSVGCISSPTGGLNITSDGKYVIVAALTFSPQVIVSVFSRNTSNGSLTTVASSPSIIVGMDSLTDAVISPDANTLYMTQLDTNIFALNIDSATGQLSNLSGSPYQAPYESNGLAVSPDGHTLYVTQNNPVGNIGNMIGAFSRTSNGVLTALTNSPFTSGDSSHFFGVGVSIDGLSVAAFSRTGGLHVVIFSRDASGNLVLSNNFDFSSGGLDGGNFVISPDNNNIYSTEFSLVEIDAFKTFSTVLHHLVETTFDNSGGSSGTFNINGSLGVNGNILFNGNPINPSAFVSHSAGALTAHQVVLGNGAGDIKVFASGTVGQVLTSSGTGVDPTWQFVGGTGTVTSTGSLTAHQVVLGNGSSDIKAFSAGISGQVLTSSGAGVDPSWQFVSGTGTVTTVSVTTANGVSGSVVNASTTPAITLTLGAITPTSVNGVVVSGSATPTLAVTGASSISGDNTGDQTDISGNAGTATALQTSRAIAFSDFDGTSDIDIFLDNLSDVALDSPVLGDVLKWNGAVWVNGSIASGASAGSGISFFPSATLITDTGTENATRIRVLNRSPDSAVETLETAVVNASTIATLPLSAYQFTSALNRTSIDAGVWNFHTWAGVSAAPSLSQIIRSVARVRPASGTVTVTGAGTSRTVTASTDTPFNTADITASADITLASYVQTPKGLYPITSRTSDTVVTITVPAGYGNETAVVFSVWKQLFNATSADINDISPAYGLFENATVQPSYPLDLTDELGVFFFATTTRTSNTTITYVHSGTVHYSHFDSPLATMHNEISGLQGGTSNQFYHLTAAEYTGTGSGAFARAVSPVFTTPNIGSATGSVSGTAGALASVAVGSSGITMNTAKLLGRSTASTGSIEEITVGTNLTLSGGTLSASGGSGTVTSVSVATANGFSGTVANASTTPAVTIVPGVPWTYLGTAGGTADVITLSTTPAPVNYAAMVGMNFRFKASGTNTVSPPTINFNGLGAINTSMGSVAVPVGGVLSGNWYDVFIENPTSFRLSPVDAVSSNGDTINGDLTFTSGGVVGANNLATLTDAQTLTNKRILPRVDAVTNQTSLSVNADNFDIVSDDGLTGAVTVNNPTGTPQDSQILIYKLTGTAARAITWGTGFESSTVILPTSTSTTQMLTVAFMWNTATSKWRCIGVA